ncbi:MAG: hypothetical protein WCO55_04730 [Candidatus Falkowbacteria bacterium]
MIEEEITVLAEKILTFSKELEKAIDPSASWEKRALAHFISPLMTEVLKLSCQQLTPKECFLLYLKIEKLEILSPDNAWFTGLEVGHEPDQHEEAMHYCEYGGPQDFCIKFGWLKHAYQQDWPLPVTN